MVVHGFENSLASLKGTTVRTSNPERFPEPGIAPVELYFSDGSRSRTDYWRIIRDGKARTSSFDHQQRYGLPVPIDCVCTDRSGAGWKNPARSQMGRPHRRHCLFSSSRILSCKCSISLVMKPGRYISATAPANIRTTLANPPAGTFRSEPLVVNPEVKHSFVSQFLTVDPARHFLGLLSGECREYAGGRMQDRRR